MSKLRQIKASAGSGKTYTLTSNYIEKLVAGNNASEILAITFTNAAATEMRDRVILRLKEMALNKDQKFTAEAQKEAGKWINYLLRDMNSLNIRTIDSLLHMIVRASTLQLEINPDFEPVFNSDDILKSYAEKFLESSADSDLLAKALSALEEKRQGFKADTRFNNELLNIFQDALLRKFEKVSKEEEIQASIKERQNELWAKLGMDQTQAFDWEQTENMLASACKLFLDGCLNSGQPFNGKVKNSLQKFCQSPLPEKMSAYFDKTKISELFNQKAKCEHLQPDWDELVPKVKCYYDLKENIAVIKKALLLIPFIKLAEKLADDFLEDQINNGKLPTALIPGYASQALEIGTGVSDALCRIGVTLSHFLVDEFQDTSQEQWDVLHSLVLEALAGNGSLTWVGDVKQSIYGWRDANPSLFDGVLKNEELKRLEPEPDRDTLDYNWRSKANIVEFNNSIFTQLGDTEICAKIMEELLPKKDMPDKTFADAVKRVVAAYGNTHQDPAQNEQSSFDGYIDCELLQPDEILTRLISKLNEISQRRPLSDVYVLFRGNKDIDNAAEELVKAGIPIITDSSLLLKDNTIVSQTISLLTFLDNPVDSVAFSAVISGNVFLESKYIQENTNLTDTVINDWIISAVNTGIKEKKNLPLYWRFEMEKPEIWENIFKPFLNKAALMSPYDLVLEWYSHMRVESRFPDHTTFIRRFMEVLFAAERKGFNSIASFLEFWSEEGSLEKAPMPQNEKMDAASLMTIHKAKGLEAPVIIVPRTDYYIGPPDNFTTAQYCGLVLPMRSNTKATGSQYYEEYIKQALETLNLLYVAFTRPKEELHFFVTEKTGRQSWKNLNDGLKVMFANAKLTAPFSIGNIPESSLKPDQPAENRLVEPKITEEENWHPMSWLNKVKIERDPLSREMDARQKGNFIHFCLEHLQGGQSSEEEIDNVFKFALNHSDIIVPDHEQAELLASLHWLASFPEIKKWLATGWPEHPLMDEDGELYRADLLAPTAKGYLVLDYKSGVERPEHIEQVRNYLRCIPTPHAAILIYLSKRCFQLVTETRQSALLVSLPEEVI